jgi:uncharacterized caspase-like protein
MNLRLLVSVFCCLLPLLVSAAQAERRVALIIGNGRYAAVPGLDNPENDASDIGAALRGLGFEVEIASDAGRAAMDGAIGRFGQKAYGADIALLFYSGHGMQVDGENYLLPVDFQPSGAGNPMTGALRLSAAMQAMAGAANKIIILDACRDNPFVAKLRSLGNPRSIGPGLAAVSTGERYRALGSGLAQPSAGEAGTLIAFSTSPGSVASDGSGRHSPFTAALLQYLASPGLGIQQVLTYVRRAVITATGGRQTPWDNSSLLQDIVLRPPATASAAASSPTQIPGTSNKAQLSGRWLTTLTCPAFSDARGYTLHFVATIENGHFHAARGVIGQPDTFIWDGDIDPNGRAMITQAGYTGDSVYALRHVASGTFVQFPYAVQFNANQANGSRVEDGSNGKGRPCSFTALRQ